MKNLIYVAAVEKNKIKINLQELQKQSHCIRKKVSCIITKNGKEIANGVNGTVSGFPNVCETPQGTTSQETIHAEINAIAKCAKKGISTNGATMYVSLSPCVECAKLIIQAWIKKVYYLEEYRNKEGIELLTKAKIENERF